MHNGLSNLNNKINSILNERKLPQEIIEIVEGIFQEYRTLYQDNIKDNQITSYDQFIILKDIKEHIEKNIIQAMQKIDNEYRQKCIDKAEVIIMILATFEPQKSKDCVIEKSESNILTKSIINSRENNLFIEHIINTVIDAIEKSKNEWFNAVEAMKSRKERQEYISGQIKLIENSAKLQLGNLKDCLEIDDKEILEQTLKEYKEYKESLNKTNKSEQNPHEKFVNEFKVSQQELQRNTLIQENNSRQIEQEDKDI